jgi:hypothetical protein
VIEALKRKISERARSGPAVSPAPQGSAEPWPTRRCTAPSLGEPRLAQRPPLAKRRASASPRAARAAAEDSFGLPRGDQSVASPAAAPASTSHTRTIAHAHTHLQRAPTPRPPPQRNGTGSLVH